MNKDTPNRPVRDIFTEQISVFSCPITSNNSAAHHHTRTIGQVIEAGEVYAPNVQQIRQARLTAMDAYRQGDVRGYDLAMEQYTKLKQRAHFCLFQGVCPTRKDNAFERYSRVLTLDIDAPKPTESSPCNTWVKSWEEVKDTISKLPFVAYCGLSIGGMGLFVLIPIKDPQRHGDYFNTLAMLFKKHLRLDVDPSTKNIARARFISYDPAPYINHQAVEWDAVLPVQAKQKRPSRAMDGVAGCHDPGRTTLTEAEKKRVLACVDWCIKGHVSIADNYDDWMRLAAFFAHNWSDGEGEALFHELAGLSDKYDVYENDRKLENMKAAHPRPATLHTFYRLCLNHGCPIPNDWRMTSSSRRLVKFREVKSRAEVEAENRAKQGAAPREEKPPQEAITAPVSAPPVPTDIVMPPPAMSAGERQELKRHQGDIEKGRAIIRRMTAEVEGFGQFMADYNLDLAGLDDWVMTPAQVYAVSTGAFV